MHLFNTKFVFYGPGEDGKGNIVKEGDSGKGGEQELSSAAHFVTFKKGCTRAICPVRLFSKSAMDG